MVPVRFWNLEGLCVWGLGFWFFFSTKGMTQRLDAFMHQKDGGETEDCRYKHRLLKALQKNQNPKAT